MSQLQDMLRDADPLRRERRTGDDQRARIRQAVLAASAGGARTRSARRASAMWLVAAPIVLVLIAAFGWRFWSGGSATLHAAAVRFEVRLAESEPTPGLRPARVAGSSRTIYLHEEVVVTNDDILQSRVVAGNDASHFNVALTLTAAGGDKMRRATANHIGRPVALLVDGDVISAPTVRAAIGIEGLISGDFSKAEADRISTGMMIR